MMPFSKVLARRERAEREGWWQEPPFGFLSDAGMDMSAWLDALSTKRADSLIETWRQSQQTISPEERRAKAEKARFALYG